MKLTTLFILPLSLGLLISCSQQEGTAPHDTSVLMQASDILLVNPHDLLHKAVGVNDGQGYTDDFSHTFSLNNGSETHFNDGFLDFKSAAGTLPEPDVEINANWMGDEGSFGYNFSPDGYQFNEGVEVAYDVDGILQSDVLEDGQYLVMYWDMENGQYEEIPTELVEVDGKTMLKARLYHFSKWVIGIGPPPGGGGGGGGSDD